MERREEFSDITKVNKVITFIMRISVEIRIYRNRSKKKENFILL